MENVLGKMVMYSLSSKLEINWDNLFDVAKENGLPYELVPMPVAKRRDRNVLEIKEVRRSIVRVAEKNLGVSLRSNGGVIFIPQDNVEEWDVYERTLTNKQFDGVEITSVDIADTDENKKKVILSLLNEVKDGFETEIYKLTGNKKSGGNLKELVRDFVVCAENNPIKIDATNNMYNRLLVVKDKVESYEVFLNADLAYITNNLDVAIKGFRKVFDRRSRERYVDEW